MLLRTGSPWRDLPERCGPYTTAYDRFTGGLGAGVWVRVLVILSAKSPGSMALIDRLDHPSPSTCRRRQEKRAKITPSAVFVAIERQDQRGRRRERSAGPAMLTAGQARDVRAARDLRAAAQLLAGQNATMSSPTVAMTPMRFSA